LILLVSAALALILVRIRAAIRGTLCTVALHNVVQVHIEFRTVGLAARLDGAGRAERETLERHESSGQESDRLTWRGFSLFEIICHWGGIGPDTHGQAIFALGQVLEWSHGITDAGTPPWGVGSRGTDGVGRAWT
jgi:hypothetical protein